MRREWKPVLILMFVLLFMPIKAFALDVNCSSLEISTVQSCINTVDAAGGGTVYLPAGSVTWTTYLFLPGGVNLVGYGTPAFDSGSVDGKKLIQSSFQTTIKSSTDRLDGVIVCNWKNGTKHYNRRFRIANINFVGTVNNVSFVTTFIRIDSGKDFRIDHCFFDRGYYMIGVNSQLGEDSTGVIDHCTFSWAAYTAGAPGVYGIHVSPRWTYDDTRPKKFGIENSDFVFAEDCYFENMSGHQISGFAMGRWVLRYSVTKLDWHTPGQWDPAPDLHGPCFEGTCGQPSGRGGWGFEVYGNKFIAWPDSQGQMHWVAVFIRSGDGVVWGNTFTNFRHVAGVYNDSDYQCRSGPAHCSDSVGHNYNGSYSGDGIWVWGNTENNISESRLFVYDGGFCSTECLHVGIELKAMAKPGYAPYTYPHPLVSGASAGLLSPPLNPPKNLSITKPGDSIVASNLQPSPSAGVSVVTDKSSYILWQTPLITVTVLDNAGKPVVNAHCVITVKRPDGTTGGGMTPYTNKTGIAKAQFRVNQVGSYTAKVAVNKGTVVLGKATTTFIGTK